MAKFFKCTAVDGGGAGAVDAILTADIEDSNSNWDGVALVIGGGMFAVYEYDSTCTESESIPDIIIPDDNSSGTGAWRRKGGYFPEAAVMRKNLVVKTTGVEDIDVDCDLLDVIDASGRVMTLNSVDVSIDITASGANGLDTGSEANSTAYNVFVIADEDHNHAGILSTSAAPSLPSGYTHWRKVGEAYNDSGGDLVLFHRVDDEVWFEDPQTVYTGQSLTTSYVSHNLPSAVPSGCTELIMEANGTTNVSVLQIISPDSTPRFEVSVMFYGTSALNYGATGGYGPTRLRMKHLGATTIYARANHNATYANQGLFVWGYRKAV